MSSTTQEKWLIDGKLSPSRQFSTTPCLKNKILTAVQPRGVEIVWQTVGGLQVRNKKKRVILQAESQNFENFKQKFHFLEVKFRHLC